MKNQIYHHALKLSDYLQSESSFIGEYDFALFDSFKALPGKVNGIYGKLVIKEELFYHKEADIKKLLELFLFKVDKVSGLSGYIELSISPTI